MTSIPAALRMLIEGREHDHLDHADPDLILAETTEQILQVLLDTGIGIDEVLDNRPSSSRYADAAAPAEVRMCGGSVQHVRPKPIAQRRATKGEPAPNQAG
jgi:hypothetical protein